MQTIATYYLEHTSPTVGSAIERFTQVSNRVNAWLIGKEVADPEKSQGTFASKTVGQQGNYRRVRLSVRNGDLQLEETTLSEPTAGGQTFTTRICVIRSANACTVYSTLGVQNDTIVVAPFSVNPRCPAIVRDLVSTLPNWVLGGETIEPPAVNRFSGSDEAELLVAEILRPDRRLPIVVISEIEGEPIWPGITDNISYDLTALAKVYQIDEEASWKFTELLGKQNSCYSGAIRLYWPARGPLAPGSTPPSTVWTTYALMSDDVDGKGPDRFRAQLRRTIMRVASLTIEPPLEIRHAYNETLGKRIESLKAIAAEKESELEIAKSCFEENEKLQAEVDRLQLEVANLVARTQAAEHALSQRGKEADADVPSSEEGAPAEGEIRFYKKTRSTPSHDVMVRVKGCDHSNWQSASKAEKAKKGIERLEGRNDWSTINHCGSCTGGGMWKVKW